MRKKISVKDLLKGMFLDGFDASWFNTPFIKHHFMIDSDSLIEKIRESGITHVFIDTDKGLDAASAAKKPAANPAMEKPADEAKSKVHELVESEPRRQVDVAPPAEIPDITPPCGDDEESFKAFARRKDQYLQIERAGLIVGSYVDFILFIKNGMDIKLLLGAKKEGKKKDVLITDEVLKTSGEILINRDDTDRYKVYLNDAVKQMAATMNAQQSKNFLVKETTKMLMKELMENPRSGEKMKESEKAVEDIIDSIINSKGVVSNLITINKHDYYTYTHCVNVSVFSVGTAMALGIKSDAELFAIGVGGLLHDIGKSTIPPEILSKHPDRLNTFETTILKEHVVEGVNLVKLFKGIPEDAMYPLREHHERLSGSGYPFGIKGDKMHISGKIAAVVNLYDTLTTSRPNYRAMTPFETLTHMRSLSDDYDQDIFKEFVNLLGKSL